MTIFPYIKAIRKGILYPQEINKLSLFTDFHVPTNRGPPTLENTILFFPQSVGSVFLFFYGWPIYFHNSIKKTHKQTKQLLF